MTAEILKKYFGLNDPNFIQTILKDPVQVARYDREYAQRLASEKKVNYDDFFKMYNGLPVDDDLAYGNQCMDLYRKLCKFVGAKIVPAGYAAATWNKYDTDKFERIPNTRWFIPKKGDAMVWGAWQGNPYGHISVINTAAWLSFVSMDINWPTEGYWKNGVFIGTGKAHFVTHNYTNPKVIGVLRPKVVTVNG